MKSVRNIFTVLFAALAILNASLFLSACGEKSVTNPSLPGVQAKSNRVVIPRYEKKVLILITLKGNVKVTDKEIIDLNNFFEKYDPQSGAIQRSRNEGVFFRIVSYGGWSMEIPDSLRKRLYGYEVDVESSEFGPGSIHWLAKWDSQTGEVVIIDIWRIQG